jgi:hypothetical protein
MLISEVPWTKAVRAEQIARNGGWGWENPNAIPSLAASCKGGGGGSPGALPKLGHATCHMPQHTAIETISTAGGCGWPGVVEKGAAATTTKEKTTNWELGGGR